MKSLQITEFTRLRNDSQRSSFHSRLSGPQWWQGGIRRSAEFGWIDVFLKSDGKCVYCSRDLAASTDTIAELTEEHLVPRSLLEANGTDFDNEHNLAVCCAGCNGLKADALPPDLHPCWNSRKAFIKECSRYIARRRLDNFQKYKDHVEKILIKRAGLAVWPANPPKYFRKIPGKTPGPARSETGQNPGCTSPSDSTRVAPQIGSLLPPPLAIAIPPRPETRMIPIHLPGSLARPANFSREWTPEDDTILQQEFNAGTPLPELAAMLRRGIGGTVNRLVRLFLITPERQAVILTQGRSEKHPSTPGEPERALAG